MRLPWLAEQEAPLTCAALEVWVPDEEDINDDEILEAFTLLMDRNRNLHPGPWVSAPGTQGPSRRRLAV